MSPPLSDDDLIRLRHGDAADRAALAARAAADPALALRLAGWDCQDETLRALYPPVEDEPLPRRLRDALRPPPPPRGSLWRVAAAAALMAVIFGAGFWAGRGATPAPAALADAALRSHATYVVETAHPVEVPASDEAHLVRWLSKRLGQPIKAPDLAAEGFRLIGGRLLPGDESPAALLMYEDDLGRRLSLYVTRAEGGAEDLRFAEAPGAQAFWWVEGTLGCALVGDLPRDQLRHLAIAAYHGLTEA
jgi:anti-sigma factor RsiW